MRQQADPSGSESLYPEPTLKFRSAGQPTATAGSRSSASQAALSQTTLKKPAEFSGPGLFHGVDARVRLLPAAENTGIMFRRTDLVGKPEVPGRVEYVRSAARRTVLAANGAEVETVEHLMAALAGLQVDNCVVEINAPEVPSGDGSCLMFCDAILNSGIQQLGSPRKLFRPREAHAAAGSGGERIELTPLYGDAPSFCYQLDYGAESPVPVCSFSVDLTPETFMREIAAARTFVPEDEIETLQRMGFGRHLTGRDIVVFCNDGTISDNSLRWADEPVRHKILDCIGDLSLCGLSFVGQIIASKSGHRLNHVMASTVSMISGRGIAVRHAA
jgi:UDP-3-O-[3-hydroxymyristoyl] N-acetylglucosamine deacetylase